MISSCCRISMSTRDTASAALRRTWAAASSIACSYAAPSNQTNTPATGRETTTASASRCVRTDATSRNRRGRSRRINTCAWLGPPMPSARRQSCPRSCHRAPTGHRRTRLVAASHGRTTHPRSQTRDRDRKYMNRHNGHRASGSSGPCSVTEQRCASTSGGRRAARSLMYLRREDGLCPGTIARRAAGRRAPRRWRSP